jgi:hypothetical protein
MIAMLMAIAALVALAAVLVLGCIAGLRAPRRHGFSVDRSKP